MLFKIIMGLKSSNFVETNSQLYYVGDILHSITKGGKLKKQLLLTLNEDEATEYSSLQAAQKALEEIREIDSKNYYRIEQSIVLQGE